MAAISRNKNDVPKMKHCRCSVLIHNL